MEWPLGTGGVCRLLSLRDYQLYNLIRAGKVTPRVQLGRVVWSPDQVLAAAKLLGKDSLEIRNLCADAMSEGGAE